MRRRLLVLAGLAAAGWWFFRRREKPDADGVTIGYADGSSVTLAAGSPEHDRLASIAAAASAPLP
jgi:hypothetical protein